MKDLFITIFVMFISTVYSQEKHQFSVETGAMQSSLRSEVIGGRRLGTRIYLLAGIEYRYAMTTQFAIKTGLSFERKGIKAENIIPSAYQTQKINVDYDYLILPLQISWKTKGATYFYTNTGMFFGFLLSQKVVFKKHPMNPGFTEDRTNETKRYDLGPIIEMGLGFQVLGRKCEVGLRESFGLIDTNLVDAPNVYSVWINSLGLKVGVSI